MKETNSGDESAPLMVRLQSKEHEEILNVIDQLRSEGVSQYVDLPQLIVCGDQSSGKSSVLEAISGLNFPRKDSLCTRFATELILRRSDESGVRASILPDEDRSVRDKDRLRGFSSPTLQLGAFGDIVKSAEEFMGVGQHGSEFSKDVLRVEVFGPTQPHLTMVDLPGLYHGESESQSQGGVALVEELVLSYMKKSRSVILAVMSAQSEIPLQKVTTFTRKVDPNGERTMGIITKPDTLSKGSPMEQSFYRLAQNKNKSLQFRLGWHVLKNRKYEELQYTLQERHTSEAEFLSKGVWSSLPRNQVGVETLRPRLSNVLKDHILTQMPGFIAETQSILKITEHSLSKLGQARETLPEQRDFLLKSGERFANLMNSAVHGLYGDYFFKDPLEDEGYERRLRAVVQNRLLDFAEEMRKRGQHRTIVDDDEYSSHYETSISRSAFVNEVQQRIRRSRGRELPGTFNPLIAGDLFYLQSRPWEGIVNKHIEMLVDDVRRATIPMLEEVLDEQSLDGILKHVINPYITDLEEKLRTKSTELLKSQQTGHPITYNDDFTNAVLEARHQHQRSFIIEKLETFFGSTYPNLSAAPEQYYFSMSRLIDSLSERNDSKMEEFACSEATDCMLAFYKVARKHLVDDFSNLAVEKCLLEPLPKMFCSATIYQLKDDMIEEIASEDEETRTERKRLKEKLDRLRWASTKLQRLDRRKIRVYNENDNSTEAHTKDDKASGSIVEDDDSKEGIAADNVSEPVSEPLVPGANPEVPTPSKREGSQEPIATWLESANSTSKKMKKKKKHPGTALYE